MTNNFKKRLLEKRELKEKAQLKADVDKLKEYSDYLAKQIEEVITYTNYLKDEMEKDVRYSEYLAEHLDRVMSYINLKYDDEFDMVSEMLKKGTDKKEIRAFLRRNKISKILNGTV